MHIYASWKVWILKLCKSRQKQAKAGKSRQKRLNAAKCGYMHFLKETLLKLNQDRSRLHEQLRRRPKQHFAQNLKLYTCAYNPSAVPFKKQTFLRRAKLARFCEPRMTPEPLDRPLTLVDKQNGISTFSFSQSTDRVPLTSKYIHVYNSSSWVQNWKQNSKSRRFGKVMIKTSFTLFSKKKTPSYDENHENSMRGTDDQIYCPISARAHTSFAALPTLANPLKINEKTLFSRSS